MGKNIDHLELVWQGKYDEKGELRQVERTILPFQVVETVNESKVDREASLLFRAKGEEPGGWRNKLIWGDNKVVMSSLLPEFTGKINLIYIDPPFATGQNFSFRVQVGDEEVVKEPSIIEEKAYRDTWSKYGPGRQVDSYLEMMYDRLALMRELLAENGSIYVHLDWHVGHYVKLLIDDIFGGENFVNEIIWRYRRWPAKTNRFQKMHDIILWYARNDELRRTWNQQYESLASSTLVLCNGWITGCRFLNFTGMSAALNCNGKDKKGAGYSSVTHIGKKADHFAYYLLRSTRNMGY